MRFVAVTAWVLLPTVMFGGDALMRLMLKGSVLSPHKEASWFRAGHAHGGSLLLLVLIYINFMDETGFEATTQAIWSTVALVGALGVSGGFFWHMHNGTPHQVSAGIRCTAAAAAVLAVACLALSYGLAVA